MFSVFWRGKRTPQDRDATAFILLEYDVFGDVTLYRHLPGIRHDMYDIMSWETAVGRKLPMITYRPVTAIPGQLKGRNQGPMGLDYRSTGISSA